MFSAQYVIAGLIVGMSVGAVSATVVLRILVIDPLHRDLRDANRLLTRSGRQTDRALALTRQHQGTPYIRTAPGIRVVDGRTLYSAEWLNDGAAS